MDKWYKWFPPYTFEPQGQWLASGWSDDKIRVTSVQIAAELVGVGPTKQLYLDACYPGDSPHHAVQLAASQSVCALLAACILRCLGCRHHLLEPPYYGRNDAMSRLETVARDSDAWEGPDALPEAGDIAIIGTDASRSDPDYERIIRTWGTPGHALICTNRVLDRKSGNMMVESVDGGRGPIQEKSRRIRKSGSGEIWLAGWTTRRVYGVIRVGKLSIDPDAEWCMPVRTDISG